LSTFSLTASADHFFVSGATVSLVIGKSCNSSTCDTDSLICLELW
jgi:hypothetical protein